jgi:hypothetical protein
MVLRCESFEVPKSQMGHGGLKPILTPIRDPSADEVKGLPNRINYGEPSHAQTSTLHENVKRARGICALL